MNYKEKQEERKRVLSLFRNNYQEGCIKISTGESLIHSTVKLQVAYYLKQNGYQVWCEPNLKCNARPDLICLNGSGHAYIVEIVNSESDGSIESKKLTYPLPIIVVDVNSFKFEEFKI